MKKTTILFLTSLCILPLSSCGNNADLKLGRKVNSITVTDSNNDVIEFTKDSNSREVYKLLKEHFNNFDEDNYVYKHDITISERHFDGSGVCSNGYVTSKDKGEYKLYEDDTFKGGVYLDKRGNLVFGGYFDKTSNTSHYLGYGSQIPTPSENEELNEKYSYLINLSLPINFNTYYNCMKLNEIVDKSETFVFDGSEHVFDFTDQITYSHKIYENYLVMNIHGEQTGFIDQNILSPSANVRYAYYFSLTEENNKGSYFDKTIYLNTHTGLIDAIDVDYKGRDFLIEPNATARFDVSFVRNTKDYSNEANSLVNLVKSNCKN